MLQPYRAKLLIDGEWRDSKTTEWIDLRNPVRVPRTFTRTGSLCVLLMPTQMAPRRWKANRRVASRSQTWIYPGTG